MTKLKPSSKLSIFAIISCALIVIGMVLGTVFHFVGNGFFNYAGEYSSYKSVTVSYPVIEMTGGEIDLESVCETAFDNAGVSSYIITKDSTPEIIKSNGNLEYRFTTSTDSAALKAAVKEINAKIKEGVADIFGDPEDVPRSLAVMHEQETLVGGKRVVTMAAIALAVIVVVHMLYTIIRFRLSAACTAIVADLHNLALYAALLALCRVPVTSTVMVFAVLLTLATAIGVTYMLERIKRNAKEDAKLSVEEVTDKSAGETFKANVILPAFLAIAAILLFAVMAISSMSIVTVLTPALLAIVGFVVTVYGTVMFAPAFYCFIKKIFNKTKKPSQKKGN